MSNTMDYFKEAFGGFSPESDIAAALKFGLCVLMLDNRTTELIRLVQGERNFGGVEGDPGWIIERREDGERIGYESWPSEARFRAYVDPDGYSLAHPEFFCDEKTFFSYVRDIVTAFVRRNPDRSDVARDMEEAMSHRVK
jgi:hypothetical protein